MKPDQIYLLATISIIVSVLSFEVGLYRGRHEIRTEASEHGHGTFYKKMEGGEGFRWCERMAR